MRYLPLTLPTPAENLALDEALLTDAEGETLRIWESPETMVVVGRASLMKEEVDVDACRAAGAPCLRRLSGGAAIVAGPGCLMYAVTLDIERRLDLAAVDRAHAFVLGRIAAALQTAAPAVERAGTSDLVLRPVGETAMKFSGNSVRVTRTRLLYHGTLLYAFNLSRVGALLRAPPRQPDYRGGRTHDAFIANLPVERGTLEKALAAAWDAGPPTRDYPAEAVRRLVSTRYALDSWTLSR